MSNENKNFVWAVFDSEEEAIEAAESLKDWDDADDEIKLGAIGVLHMTKDGKLTTKKMGPRSTGSGALIGAILGGLVALFSPATLIGGALTGGLAGGILGAFHKQGLGLSDEQKDDISYYYASRLPGEPADGVEDVHFHPLEPRSVRGTISYHW